MSLLGDGCMCPSVFFARNACVKVLSAKLHSQNANLLALQRSLGCRGSEFHAERMAQDSRTSRTLWHRRGPAEPSPRTPTSCRHTLAHSAVTLSILILLQISNGGRSVAFHTTLIATASESTAHKYLTFV